MLLKFEHEMHTKIYNNIISNIQSTIIRIDSLDLFLFLFLSVLFNLLFLYSVCSFINLFVHIELYVCHMESNYVLTN